MYSSSKLISVEEALVKISEHMKPIEEKETIPVKDAYGRVCAEDVFSSMDNPPFNRSEVDGFAVRTDELTADGVGETTTLDIGGTVEIGISTHVKSHRNACLRIATGSVIPNGYDAVFRKEDVSVSGNRVTFSGKLPKFTNIAMAGSDVLRGDLIVRKDTKITEKEMGILSITGVIKITVFRKIRIGIIPSGNELAAPGNELKPGQTYEGNATILNSIIGRYHFFSSIAYDVVPDGEEETMNAMEKAFRENDVVITTGGSSAGEKDFIGKIAASYSPGIIFHGIDMKPGKPTFFAMNGKKMLIGLPGFPVSSFIAFKEIFLEKLLEMAHFYPELTITDVELAMEIGARKGGTNYIPLLLNAYDNIYAFPIGGESGSISRVLRSDCIGEVVAKDDHLYPGDTVTVKTIDNDTASLGIVFVGYTDPLMDTLFSISGYRISMYRTSLEDGMRCLEQGSAPFMGFMIDDGKKPSLRIKAKHSFFRIFTSETGLIFRKDDTIISGAAEPENGIVVGVPGYDMYSRNSIEKCIAALPSTVNHHGYSTVIYNDIRSIALAVRSGTIPVGLGNRHTASQYNLDFKPVLRETYYVVAAREREDEFIDALKNARKNGALKVLSEKYVHYEIHNDTFPIE